MGAIRLGIGGEVEAEVRVVRRGGKDGTSSEESEGST